MPPTQRSPEDDPRGPAIAGTDSTRRQAPATSPLVGLYLAMSSRALAPVLGVSKTTIHRDKKHAGEHRIRGLDGKSYPSNRATHRQNVLVALDALGRGVAPSIVSRELQVSSRTVRRWKARYVLVERPGVPDGTGGQP